MGDKNQRKSLSSAAGEKNTNSPKTPKAKWTLSQLIEKYEKQENELRCLRDFSEAQAAHIVSLEEKYSSLELKLRKNELDIERFHSLATLKDNVIVKLQHQINQQEQRSRRPCATVVGIPKRKEESSDDLKREVVKLLDKSNGKVSLEDVDKFHRDGPRYGSKQEVIIRFRTHAAKESFYKARKNIVGGSETLKILPSLSKATKKLLHDSSDEVSYYEKLSNPPQFVLPDVHGNLMIKFTCESRLGLFVHFDSMDTFRSTVYRAQHTDEADDEFNCYDISDSEDESA